MPLGQIPSTEFCQALKKAVLGEKAGMTRLRAEGVGRLVGSAIQK